MTSLRRSLGSFRFALAGLRYLVLTQPNARIHLALGSIAVGLGVLLRLSPSELAVLALAIGLVLMTELVNTAVEATVDLAHPAQHRLAGIAKDLAAGAVLAAALTSLAVGALLFVPKLLPLVSGGR